MDRLESVLKEERVFYPSEEFRKQAHIKSEEEYQRLYEESVRDPEGFWGRVASELHWFEPWRKVLEGDLPHPKWFVGGKTNLSYNALDRHVKTWRRNKAAIVWEGEPGEERVLTYHDLWREVQKFANVLKRLGVKKGDRVTIYLPMIPEAVIAMLACTRIGAVHSVVFGGFSAGALADRIKDAEAKVLITADGGFRRGGIVPLKQNADEALKDATSAEHVVVVRRTGEEVPWTPGRDHWWHELMEAAPDRCDPEPMEAEEPLFILYTSGSTGKPKGVLHTTGGYIVDTWWQTETGGIMITTLPGAHAMKPGHAGKPFFGVVPEILDSEHRPWRTPTRGATSASPVPGPACSAPSGATRSASCSSTSASTPGSTSAATGPSGTRTGTT